MKLLVFSLLACLCASPVLARLPLVSFPCEVRETGGLMSAKGILWCVDAARPVCTRGAVRITPSDPEPKVLPGMLPAVAASKPSLMPRMTAQKVGAGQAHVDNWLEAALAEDPSMTVTNAEDGHRSTSLCSLGQMCMELGRGKSSFSLAWDGTQERTGNADADALMKPFANGRYDLNVNLAEFGLDIASVCKD